MCHPADVLAYLEIGAFVVGYLQINAHILPKTEYRLKKAMACHVHYRLLRRRQRDPVCDRELQISLKVVPSKENDWFSVCLESISLKLEFSKPYTLAFVSCRKVFIPPV